MGIATFTSEDGPFQGRSVAGIGKHRRYSGEIITASGVETPVKYSDENIDRVLAMIADLDDGDELTVTRADYHENPGWHQGAI